MPRKPAYDRAFDRGASREGQEPPGWSCGGAGTESHDGQR